jgi:hypothetical protein
MKTYRLLGLSVAITLSLAACGEDFISGPTQVIVEGQSQCDARRDSCIDLVELSFDACDARADRNAFAACIGTAVTCSSAVESEVSMCFNDEQMCYT